MKYKCRGCSDVFDKCGIKCLRCGTLITHSDIIEGVKEVQDGR